MVEASAEDLGRATGTGKPRVGGREGGREGGRDEKQAQESQQLLSRKIFDESVDASSSSSNRHRKAKRFNIPWRTPPTA